MYIYFARHGQTFWNIERRMQGSINTKLTDEGKKQAYLLGKRLCNEDITRIYSSPLDRAYDTAKIVGDLLKIDITRYDRLKEFCFGEWEGMTYDDIKTKYPVQWECWTNKSFEFSIPNGETLIEGMDRIVKVINEIIQKNSSNIAIVTHGTLIELYMHYLKNTNINNITMEKKISKNGSISKIEVKGQSKRIIYLDDYKHLV